MTHCSTLVDHRFKVIISMPSNYVSNIALPEHSSICTKLLDQISLQKDKPLIIATSDNLYSSKGVISLFFFTFFKLYKKIFYFNPFRIDLKCYRELFNLAPCLYLSLQVFLLCVNE